jgi:hypothetical protein
VTLGVTDGVGAGDGDDPDGMNCAFPFNDTVDDRFNINGVIYNNFKKDSRSNLVPTVRS